MEATKTLPASWYCSQNLYELERRAVFLRSWYLLGPVVRFATDQDVYYEIAGVTIRVQNPGGPENEDLLVTDKDSNTILPSHLTKTGLLFAAPSHEAPPFRTYFPDLESLTDRYDFRRLPHRRSIKYPGRFNWKTMVDGYQECLHCQYTHRSFSVLYPPTFYEVHNHVNYSRHIADPTKFNDGKDDGLFLYFFPICTLNLYGGGMSSFRVCPGAEPGETRMEFDYYHESGGEVFEEYFRFVRKVAMEDFELCEVAQGNLERGYYQQQVKRLVMDKFKEEEEGLEKSQKPVQESAPAVTEQVFAAA